MSKINNYEELIAERARLEALLQKQKASIKQEVNEVKAKLEPLSNVVSFLGIFKKPNAGSSLLLNTGLSMGIDLLVRNTPLAKVGWLARTILPAVVKGISNQLLKKNVASSQLHSRDISES